MTIAEHSRDSGCAISLILDPKIPGTGLRLSKRNYTGTYQIPDNIDLSPNIVKILVDHFIKAMAEIEEINVTEEPPPIISYWVAPADFSINNDGTIDCIRCSFCGYSHPAIHYDKKMSLLSICPGCGRTMKPQSQKNHLL